MPHNAKPSTENPASSHTHAEVCGNRYCQTSSGLSEGVYFWREERALLCVPRDSCRTRGSHKGDHSIPPKRTLGTILKILVVLTVGMFLASGAQRPVKLPNIPQCTGQDPSDQESSDPNVNSEAEKVPGSFSRLGGKPCTEPGWFQAPVNELPKVPTGWGRTGLEPISTLLGLAGCSAIHTQMSSTHTALPSPLLEPASKWIPCRGVPKHISELWSQREDGAIRHFKEG